MSKVETSPSRPALPEPAQLAEAWTRVITNGFALARAQVGVLHLQAILAEVETGSIVMDAPKPDILDAFAELSDAAGGRFDGVDASAYVRSLREDDGEAD